MEIRCAKPQDVDAIASLEAACFPQAERLPGNPSRTG